MLPHQGCWHLIKRSCVARYAQSSWLVLGGLRGLQTKSSQARSRQQAVQLCSPAICAPVSSEVVSCGRHAFWSKISHEGCQSLLQSITIKTQPSCTSSEVELSTAVPRAEFSWADAQLPSWNIIFQFFTVIWNQVKPSKVDPLATQASSTLRLIPV